MVIGQNNQKMCYNETPVFKNRKYIKKKKDDHSPVIKNLQMIFLCVTCCLSLWTDA